MSTGIVGVLKNNREKENDLVAVGILCGTGILPVILWATRQSPYRLSHHSA